MKRKLDRKHLILSALSVLLLLVAIPSGALAQNNGHGHRRGNDDHNWSSRYNRRDSKNWRKYNRKCGKFVNCHDARDGRWDNRGARGSRVGNVVWRNRLRNRRTSNNYWSNQRRYRRVISNR